MCWQIISLIKISITILDLNTIPELIQHENILPLTSNSPTIELHLNTDETFQNNQQFQDTDMEISEATFLCEQRNNPKIMKIIDSIASENPDPK